MTDGLGTVAADGTDTSWEDPKLGPATSAAPVLAVDGFEGPLDWLLELARSERIDLRNVSILALVEAFGAALERALAASSRADLSRWGTWLGMAAQLTLLRSRLLLPPGDGEAKAARAEAEALRRQLLESDAMRRAAAWLDSSEQLGREVFGRGVSADARQAGAHVADIAGLFQACLVVLRVPELAQAYQPRLPPLWRVPDAMARITLLLAQEGERELGALLPAVARNGVDHELRARAAVASTLVAGLELARARAVVLEQEQPWRAIRVTPA